MKRFNFTRLLCCLAVAAAMLSAHAAGDANPKSGSPYDIIPIPAQIVASQGTYTLPAEGVKVFVQGAQSFGIASLCREKPL